MVERQLPKLNVAGSNPVSRSKKRTYYCKCVFYCMAAGVTTDRFAVILAYLYFKKVKSDHVVFDNHIFKSLGNKNGNSLAF